MSAIGQRLKEERKRMGVSQSAFAGFAGVTLSAQGNYEASKRSPDAEYLAAVAGAGVDVLYVLTGKPSATLAIDESTLLQRYRAATVEIKSAALAVLGIVAIAPGNRAESPVATFGGANNGSVAREQSIDTMNFGVGKKR